MAAQIPVKAIYSGSDVTSLGEYASGDTIAASYISGLAGEVTGTGGATVIADNIVDEANLKVSNSPTNGYVLTAQSGASGGLTWAADSTTDSTKLPLAGGTMTGNIAHGGAFTIDTVGDLSLDSEGAVLIKNGGSAIGRISNSNSDMIIKSDTSDKDILFKGNDGGSTITALSLDMSDGGKATFNASVTAKTDTDTTNTGNITLDFAANQNFVLTLTGNVTLVNPSTEQVGQSGFIAFIQDGTGSRTVALGTDYETAGAAGLTLTSTASATDLVPYLVVASNRILLGTPQLAFA